MYRWTSSNCNAFPEECLLISSLICFCSRQLALSFTPSPHPSVLYNSLHLLSDICLSRVYCDLHSCQVEACMESGFNAGLQISSVGCCQERWTVIMDAGTGFVGQEYNISSQFPNRVSFPTQTDLSGAQRLFQVLFIALFWLVNSTFAHFGTKNCYSGVLLGNHKSKLPCNEEVAGNISNLPAFNPEKCFTQYMLRISGVQRVYISEANCTRAFS